MYYRHRVYKELSNGKRVWIEDTYSLYKLNNDLEIEVSYDGSYYPVQRTLDHLFPFIIVDNTN